MDQGLFQNRKMGRNEGPPGGVRKVNKQQSVSVEVFKWTSRLIVILKWVVEPLVPIQSPSLYDKMDRPERHRKLLNLNFSYLSCHLNTLAYLVADLVCRLSVVAY